MPTKPPYAGSFTLSTDGVLTAYGALDRETQSMYRLDVRASDLDPVHPRFNSTVVEVEILDINDNPPVFKNASYTLDVMEHSAVGSVVLRVKRNQIIRASMVPSTQSKKIEHIPAFSFQLSVESYPQPFSFFRLLTL